MFQRDGFGSIRVRIPFAEFVISTVAFAVIWTWVFNNTRGSLLLVMLLHASLNTASNVFLLRLFPLSFAMHAPVQQSLDIVMIVVALLIILATRGRLSYQCYQREMAYPVPGTDEEQEHRSRNSSEELRCRHT
jgi:ABC-type sugar transport system permease subunit